jgi:hypothetical protein
LTFRFASAAKVMLPLKLMESFPASPLTVRLGKDEVNEPKLAVSLPAPRFSVTDVIADSEMDPESPVVLAAPSTLKVRPLTANLMFPEDGSVMAIVSPLPEVSVTTMALPVVVIV